MSKELFSAIYRGGVDSVRNLLTGADLGAKDEFGRPVLSVAAAEAAKTDLTIVRMVLDAGADVNAVQGPDADEEEGWTALHQAALVGMYEESTEVVRLLLARGARIVATRDGSTPVHFALQANNLGIVELLLEHGADPNAKMATGQSLLHYVVDVYGHRKANTKSAEELEDYGEMAESALKLLLARGANASARDASGETALAKALIGRLPERCLLALVRAGSPLDELVDLGGHKFTPVAMSIGLGAPASVLAAMLDRGVDVLRPIENGRQSLFHFACTKRLDAVETILAKCPDIDLAVRDSEGTTGLFFAAWKGKGDIVRALLDRGADPNVSDSGGNAPIHTAAKNGEAEIVSLLLSRGADRTLRNGAGQTAADRAKAAGHAAIVTLLES